MRRQPRRRPLPPRLRVARQAPWRWVRAVLLPLVELPLRLLAALLAGRALLGWLSDEGVTSTDPIESRYLLLAVIGAAALGAVVAPFLTTRPLCWLVEQLDRLGPFRLLGAGAGWLFGLASGLILASMLPPLEAEPARWLPAFLVLGSGLLGACALGGRPALIRRLLACWLQRPPTVLLLAQQPSAAPTRNGRSPGEPVPERTPAQEGSR